MAKRQGVNATGGRTQKFVSTRLATLPAGTFTDPGQTGLQLRVRAARGQLTRTWLLRFKFKGEETRLTLGHFPDTSLDAARGLAREARECAAKGIDPRRARPRRIARRTPLPLSATPAGSAHTVEFLASEFLERHVKPRHKRPAYVENILKRDVLPHWRGRDARTIKPREVVELLDQVVGRGSRVMANRLAGILGQLFLFGVHRAILEHSPVQLLYRPGGKEPPRERCLSDPELAAFLRDPVAATRFERLAHVITVLLVTGQRRGELALARWSEIDFGDRTWTVPDAHSKTGKGHAVPLPDLAIDALEGLQRLANRSRYVLPNETGTGPIDPKLLTRGIARCLPRMRKLGIAAFTLHDLRRTCRTGLARLGVAPHIAERALNHAQEKIPGTYDTHDYLEEKRVALKKWSDHLVELRG